MSWPVSLLVSLLAGVAALLAAGLVAAAYAEWYQVSTREGAAGFMVVGVALLGGLAGGVLGLTAARLLAQAGFWKASAAARFHLPCRCLWSTNTVSEAAARVWRGGCPHAGRR